MMMKKPALTHLPGHASSTLSGTNRLGNLIMSVEISVGPPVLTINQSSTFMFTELSGEIAANGEQGLSRATLGSLVTMRFLPMASRGHAYFEYTHLLRRSHPSHECRLDHGRHSGSGRNYFTDDQP